MNTTLLKLIFVAIISIIVFLVGFNGLRTQRLNLKSNNDMIVMGVGGVAFIIILTMLLSILFDYIN